MELSVVVPCYNEEESVRELHRRVKDVCEKSDVRSYEIILVNDGSQDATLDILKELAAGDPNLVIVDLSRNFGHQLALTAGLSKSRGDYVFILDADLQDPPELLEPMLARARDGVDVVYGQRIERKGETWLKLFLARAFYRMLSYLANIDIPENAGDFRLISRRVVDELMQLPERQRFIRGMIAWIGFRQEAFPYERHARYAGETKYPMLKLIQFAFDAISSFSIRPLRISIPFAVFGAFMAGVLGLYAIVAYFLGSTVTGWASLATIVCFFAALQLLCIGMIGEYIGRTYVQVKGRPLFIIQDVIHGSAGAKKQTAKKKAATGKKTAKKSTARKSTARKSTATKKAPPKSSAG